MDALPATALPPNINTRTPSITLVEMTLTNGARETNVPYLNVATDAKRWVASPGPHHVGPDCNVRARPELERLAEGARRPECSESACQTQQAKRGREEKMPFTYRASASPSGNVNIRRVCSNSKCGGVFYISYGAQNYRCPHCDYAQ